MSILNEIAQWGSEVFQDHRGDWCTECEFRGTNCMDIEQAVLCNRFVPVRRCLSCKSRLECGDGVHAFMRACDQYDRGTAKPPFVDFGANI